jgi:Holliday junction DNA helicase RuvB
MSLERIQMDAAARIQTPVGVAGDAELDQSLRPRALDEFIGQDRLREQLGVSIEAAVARGEALDHVLLAGPPGLGKTSLAQILAAELDAPFVQTAGPALERKGDVAALLTALEPRSVFFVDEIHRLNRALEETFYPAMEDRRLPITIGQGAGAKVVTLDLPPFTLVGATTRAGLLSTPLRDRFGIQYRFEAYATEDLARIVRRSASILGVSLDEGGAWAIAARSRGTPRVANRLLKRVRDWAEVRGSGVVDDAAADAALALAEVDDLGLDRLDREILTTICVQFGGGPVGLSTLAVAVNEESDTLEDVYEPYLLQTGLLHRTPRGRAATRRAYEHLGLEAPRDSALF